MAGVLFLPFPPLVFQRLNFLLHIGTQFSHLLRGFIRQRTDGVLYDVVHDVFRRVVTARRLALAAIRDEVHFARVDRAGRLPTNRARGNGTESVPYRFENLPPSVALWSRQRRFKTG